MRSNLIQLFVLGLLLSSASAQNKPDLTNHDQKVNYALGLDIVSTFKQQEFEIDPKAFLAGMQDAIAGKPALTSEQQQAALKELQDNLAAKGEIRWKLLGQTNLHEGQAFLAANAKMPDVHVKDVVAPDGSKAQLQYKILKSGPDGSSPKKTDIVEVHYTGSFIDGTVFDSSVKRGTPATFGLTLMIPGWTEAMQMMKVGDKWQLFVPPNLAYGEYPPPGIGPNSTLVFEIELLSFYTPKEANVSSVTNASHATAE